jgi:hypothetical protein
MDLQWPTRLAMELSPGRAHLAAAKLARKKRLKKAFAAWLQLPAVRHRHSDGQAHVGDIAHAVELLGAAMQHRQQQLVSGHCRKFGVYINQNRRDHKYVLFAGDVTVAASES